MSSDRPRIAACLIVKDEEARLPACLESLRGAVDQVLVYDTGSTDATPQIAAAHGALVAHGEWHDDFGTARNAALAALLEASAPDWVLTIDADEALEGSFTGQPWLTDEAVDAVTLLVTNRRTEASWSHRGVRVFRPGRATWQGAVHEIMVSTTGAPLRIVPADAEAVALHHGGYATEDAERRKGLRNAALAAAELESHELPPARRARLLLDLGRSMLSAGRPQEALDALTDARDTAVRGDATWQSATDFLARVLLAAGEYQLATGVSADLRTCGHEQYCDWLDAQALVHLGDPSRALALLDGVEAVIDAEGRRFDPGLLHEARALAAALTGADDRAADEIALAVGRHGRITGRGPLAVELWAKAGRPRGQLVTALREHAAADPRRLEAIETELGA